MVRNRFQIQMLVGAMLFAASAATAGSIIIGGVEDTPGSSGIEKNGDFNDIVFELSGGGVAINSPGAVFNNLTPGVVNETENRVLGQPLGRRAGHEHRVLPAE